MGRKLITYILASFVAAAIGTSSSSAGAPEYHRYLIVGAGPGGLQLSHYLDTAERDYLVVDKVSFHRE